MEFLYTKAALINDKEILEIGDKLVPYLSYLQKVLDSESYDFDESSINLCLDASIIKKSSEVLGKVNPPAHSGLSSGSKTGGKNLKYIIDIGIGGSNLGTKAVYDAMYGGFDVLESDRFPKMIFADTNDSEFLEKLCGFINSNIKSKDEVLVCIVSKSGSTTETIANFEIINSAFTSKFGNCNDRYVVISDFESKLWNVVANCGIETLPIPKKVGGRYSVFSSVGIFPLMAVGCNVENLILGAKDALKKGLLEDILNNPSLVSAILLFLQMKNGKTINDNFIFHPELESLGKWYRQLMGESIGKEKDLDGNRVNVGITPTVSIGSTDLHSVGQLYLGGPKDKMTTFISHSGKSEGRIQNLQAIRDSARMTVPSELSFSGLADNIKGKSASEIMKAIMDGVKIAYQKKDLPFMEIEFSEIYEKEIGEFMQFKMIEMMFLGKLLNVNAFDQPNVEDYKTETKKILSNS